MTNYDLDVLFGNPDSETCDRKESTGFSITMKGELLDKQKELIKKKVGSGSTCFKNPTNLLDVDITKRYDWNCLNDAIKLSTMKNYTAVISYDKVKYFNYLRKNESIVIIVYNELNVLTKNCYFQLPHETIARYSYLVNYLKIENLPYITYLPDHSPKPRTRFLTATYDLDNNRFNLTVMNPYYTEQLNDIQYGKDDKEDKRNDMFLDNVLFNSQFLVDFYNGDISKFAFLSLFQI